MGHASHSIAINAEPAAVWTYVGDFNGLARWHPAIAASRLEDGGQVRRLALRDGGEFVERLLGHDDAQRSCSYSITESPLPVKRHAATIRVNATGKISTVDWRCEFESAGPPDADITTIFMQIFETGLGNLKTLLERESK
jgi:Polyketide cyclase / dehydrase and lipid transport